MKNLDPNKRPEIEIVIPVQRETQQLEETLIRLYQYTVNFKLTVLIEPDLNVSEARQKAMDEVVTNDLVCFMDDDSEMCMPRWLDMMYRVLIEQKDAGAVFGGEWWGTDNPPEIYTGMDKSLNNQFEPFMEIEKGPAACMLIDRRRITADVKWNYDIGLCSGWLGGDFEEVEYCQRLRARGLKLYRATRSLFHHTGGKKTQKDFIFTDRFKTVNIMKMLLDYRQVKAPEDDDWFKGIEYVKARDDDDCFLAPGQSLRTAYRQVIKRNGLSYIKSFHKWGLV